MLSFDVDGPTNWLARDPRVWDWPKTFSLGAYGPWRGLPRILDLLDEYATPATFFVPSWVAEAWPERFAEIDQSGHELANHGHLHETFSDMTLDAQREIILTSQTIFERLIGKRAIGFRTPVGEFSLGTLRLLHDLGFAYTSLMRGDDRPYRWDVDGEPSTMVEIPVHYELQDFPQFAFNFTPPLPKGQDRIASHQATLDNWRWEFDGYYEFGLCFVMTLDPQVIGKPGRIQILRELIEYMRSKPDVWFARGREIADWCRDHDSTDLQPLAGAP
jgi:peptidoglycan/xylan/chitin deacetylase (PgdA/CDA1 family)